MGKTGESYMAARRHLVGPPGDQPGIGIHPDTSALTRILADAGVRGPGGPLTEAFVLGVGGGLGAGYILWEFAPETDHKASHHSDADRRVVVIGFRNRWQYPDRWADSVLERLGVSFRREQTGSSAKARQQLDDALESGQSAMVDISVADLPYWHLPSEESGRWGYPIAVIGRAGDGYVVDDRSQGSLTVTSNALAIARGRIPSYKNRIVLIEAPKHLGVDVVTVAIETGLRDAVEHLDSGSDSFSLPALKKWGRMITSDAAKGWRTVFADRIGLWSALRSTHEAVSDGGMGGGSLRPLYAEFLEEVGPLLGRPGLAEVAELYRGAAAAWDDVGDATFPQGFEPLREAAELARRRRESMRLGDAGDAEAAKAASQLNSLGDEFDSELPLTESELEDLLQGLSAAIEAAYRAEVQAHQALSEVVGR
jgi:hypothetical protein